MEVADVKVKGRFAKINDAEMKVIMENVYARNTITGLQFGSWCCVL